LGNKFKDEDTSMEVLKSYANETATQITQYSLQIVQIKINKK